MKKIIILFLTFICSNTFSQSKKWIQYPLENKTIIEEKGQFRDFLNSIDIKIEDSIIGGIMNNELNAFFTKKGVYFIFPEFIQLSEQKKETLTSDNNEKSTDDEEYEKRTHKTIWKKIAFKWRSSNPTNKITYEFKDRLSSYHSYASIDGILPNYNFVPEYNKLIIKDIFDGCDITFTTPKKGGIKYELIISPYSTLKNFSFYWENIESITKKENFIQIKTAFKQGFNKNNFWQLIDTYPIAFTAISGKPIKINTEYSKNTIVFSLPESTSNSNENIIIDPWIQNPNFPDLNRAYDVQTDATGNVIILGNYSQGATKQYHIQKYNSTGTLLWSYTYYAKFLGDIAVDNPGNIYHIGNYPTGRRVKLTPSGVVQWDIPGLVEEWRLSFSTDKTILSIGGNFVTPAANLAQIDLNSGVLSNQMSYNEETRAIYTDCNGDIYALTIPNGSTCNLRKISNFTLLNTVPSGFPVNYSGTGYAYNPDYSTNIFQGFNGIIVDGNYVYIYNGSQVRKFNKNTLAFIQAVNPPGNSYMQCSGLAVDYCGNLYVGTTNGITVYDSSLTYQTTINTPGNVYDIILANDGSLLAVGETFVGNFTTNCPLPSPFVVTTSATTCAPGSIYTITSGGTPPYSYSWLPGGQTTSAITNLSPDTFYLEVSDKFCNRYNDTIIVHPTPIASFSSNAEPSLSTNLCEDSQATFNDLSIITPPDNIIGYYWNFGDGDTSTLQSPSHQYLSGTYNVTLAVMSNNNCFDTLTKVVNINPLPSPNFTTNNICSYQSAIFNNTSQISSGSITQWYWDFGDGNTDNTQNPSHLYGIGNYGIFSIKLIATSDSGCVDSISKNIIIHPKPSANFSSVNDCVDLTAIFNDLSTIPTGTVSAWNWNFGDGYTDNSQNPSHLYNQDGDYIVTLIVTSDSMCIDTIQDTITRYPIPVAYFSTNDICIYDSALFYNLSTVNNPDTINTWIWNFGDGSPNITVAYPSHLYQNFGTYEVNLTVISSNGCVDDTTLTINVHPKPIADFTADTPCVNTPPTSFTDLSTVTFGDVVNNWVWNFNNGQGTSTLQNPQFNFGADGYFPSQLIVQSDFGCSDTVIKTIRIYEKPTAEFTVDTNAFCHPYCVNFSDLSTSNSTNIIAWDWDLGNGTSNSQNPANCYSNESNTQIQNYTVTLIAKNSFGCFDTITKNNYITVWPLPLADFDAQPQPTDIYEPLIEFPNYSVGANSWLWHFGDGSQDSVNYAPQHVYADSGNYTVFLEVWNQSGCYDSIFKTIRVNPDFAIFIPNAFTPDGLGGNETFFFKGYGILEEDFEFYIFDRWGELIYQTNEFEPWDGTYKGLPAKQDVYVYKFIVKDIFDIKHQYIGKVTLLR